MKAIMFLVRPKDRSSFGPRGSQPQGQQEYHLLLPADPTQCVHVTAADGFQHCFNTSDGWLCPDHQAEMDAIIWRMMPKPHTPQDDSSLIAYIIGSERRLISRGRKVHGHYLTYLV